MEPRPTLSPRSRTPHLVWALLVILPMVGAVIAASLTDLSIGDCSYPNFGCITGQNMVGFLLQFVGPVALLVLGLGHCVIFMIQGK